MSAVAEKAPQRPETRIAMRRRGLISTDIPHPREDRVYKWAAASPTHEQSYTRYKGEGWRVVPGDEAPKLGLAGFGPQDADRASVVDVENCIRNGDLILMDISRQWGDEIKAEKAAQFDLMDGKSEKDAEAALESVRAGSVAKYDG